MSLKAVAGRCAPRGGRAGADAGGVGIKMAVTAARHLGASRSWARSSSRVLVDVGPDHDARLKAVEMFSRLMHHASAGRRLG